MRLEKKLKVSHYLIGNTCDKTQSKHKSDYGYVSKEIVKSVLLRLAGRIGSLTQKKTDEENLR